MANEIFKEQQRTDHVAAHWRRWRHAAAVFFAFVVAVAACAWAGYEIGLTKGRGWRGALIDNGCSVVCRRIGT